MAYYDALISVWTTGKPAEATGSTYASNAPADTKLAAINAWTVVQATPNAALLTPSQIINAIVPADMTALLATTSAAVVNTNMLKLLMLILLLSGGTVDASSGTIRTMAVAMFAGSSNTVGGQTTVQRLNALVSPFDSPTILWRVANGYLDPLGTADVTLAGLS